MAAAARAWTSARSAPFGSSQTGSSFSSISRWRPCGFNTKSDFNLEFQRVVGMAPKVWAQRPAGAGAAEVVTAAATPVSMSLTAGGAPALP